MFDHVKSRNYVPAPETTIKFKYIASTIFAGSEQAALYRALEAFNIEQKFYSGILWDQKTFVPPENSAKLVYDGRMQAGIVDYWESFAAVFEHWKKGDAFYIRDITAAALLQKRGPLDVSELSPATRKAATTVVLPYSAVLASADHREKSDDDIGMTKVLEIAADRFSDKIIFCEKGLPKFAQYPSTALCRRDGFIEDLALLALSTLEVLDACCGGKLPIGHLNVRLKAARRYVREHLEMPERSNSLPEQKQFNLEESLLLGAGC